MKPLFMWAGGKTKLTKHYTPLLPQTITQYYEPFFGGGAMFLEVMLRYPDAISHINDINIEIMNIYTTIKTQRKAMMAILDLMEKEYLALPATRLHRPIEQVDVPHTRYEYCDVLRHKFAGLKGYTYNQWDSTTRAAVFYFLLKTGFNGIYQASKKTGRYFTPPGLLNQTNEIYDRSVVDMWEILLQPTTITSTDWSNINYIDEDGVVIFLDPPYRGSFTSYNQSFTDNQQLELLAFARAFTNATVILTNRDTGDGFWENNAKDLYIQYINTTYTAGRRKKTDHGFIARAATEVVITNKRISNE